ncbi:MAG: amidohydrolase family protein [Bilophila wadsworthia]
MGQRQPPDILRSGTGPISAFPCSKPCAPLPLIPRGRISENAKGSIEPGKLADLVVLDANPLEVDPAALRNIGILETIVGGKTVYSARA